MNRRIRVLASTAAATALAGGAAAAVSVAVPDATPPGIATAGARTPQAPNDVTGGSSHPDVAMLRARAEAEATRRQIMQLRQAIARTNKQLHQASAKLRSRQAAVAADHTEPQQPPAPAPVVAAAPTPAGRYAGPVVAQVAATHATTRASGEPAATSGAPATHGTTRASGGGSVQDGSHEHEHEGGDD